MSSKVEYELPRTSPEQQGIPSAAVLEFVQGLEKQPHEFHSFMLLRHGSVIAEGWWSPYKREYPHMLFSLSKSVTSTAVGLAITEGYFSIDDPVLSFFPEEAPAEMSDLWAAMRVRHLLSMSTGQTADTWAYMSERLDGNWLKGFFEVPVRHAPGTHFLYNTGATYMLSAIVQKTTSMQLVDYLQPRLFEPLGIEGATWEESSQGVNLGGIGLSIKTEDIARFGQLYLQKGMWQGKQLLPETWVIEATASQISNGKSEDSDWAQGYGYQFWRCRHGAYRGDGVFGQFCIVMPEQDAVLAITAGLDVEDMQVPMDMVWEILLPAMSSEPLVEDDESRQHLNDKLSSLTLLPVQGRFASPISAEVSCRTYRVDTNDLKIETIKLDFDDSGCMLTVKTLAGVETIACGYGKWQAGQTILLNEPSISTPSPVVTSGAWTAEDCFTMVVRLYETPFFHTLVYHFMGNEMMVEIGVNVTLRSQKALLLTANL